MRHEKKLLAVPVPPCPDLPQYENEKNGNYGTLYHIRYTAEVLTVDGEEVLGVTTFHTDGTPCRRFWQAGDRYGVEVFREMEYGYHQYRNPGKMYEAAIESIYEGFGRYYNEFKTLWDGAVAGTNGWRPVFLPWYMEPEYRKPVEPGTVWTNEERKLQEQYGLDEEQLAWRRWCIKTNCGGDEQLFRQEYPNTPDEAFLLSGDPFFNNDIIMARRRAATKPLRVGLFEHDEPEIEGGAPKNFRFADGDKEKGFIRIYEEPKPGRPYVIGGDTAGEGSDCFTAHVLDNTDGHQVAELQHPLSEILYARQVFCLGHYYNNALIGLEVNFSTYPERKLEEWHYPRLYQRERFDTFANTMVKSFGWVTSPKTRPAILAELHTIMDEAPELVVSFPQRKAVRQGHFQR